MHKNIRRSWFSFGLLLLFIVYSFITSCISSKKIIYFNDLPDTFAAPMVMNHLTPFIDPKIESNDILAITVQSTVQNNTNAPITSNSTATFNALNGFLVDRNGYVELSLIGFVKVAGLTTSEARELIKQKAKQYFNDPVVNVRIANFEIIIQGDVTRPGTVTSASEKISILDALSLAGDLQLTARRDNILLVRTEGEEKKFVRFDLRSSKVFESPYFYLKQHDYIYVEPNKYKIQSSDNTLIRNLGIITSVISIASLVLIFKSIK